jgi:formylglycine-generating enzyme required for sulfatase activity
MAEGESGPGEGAGGRRARARAISREQLFAPLARPTAEAAPVFTSGVGIPFVLVPAGTFLMGSPPDEPGHRTNEGPVHEVVIGRRFYLSAYPVSQRTFALVTGRNPARFHAANGGGPDHPVETVSWDEAVGFCRRLTELPDEREAGQVYRLPTEAEWEYAARSGRTGTADPPAGGQANFDARPAGGVSAGRTTPLGRHPANAWGLSDLLGNVWEWCQDWYGEGYYATSPPRDPAGPAEGKFRVLRGGSWKNQMTACRVAYRNALAPHMRDAATGFRVVLELPS